MATKRAFADVQAEYGTLLVERKRSLFEWIIGLIFLLILTVVGSAMIFFSLQVLFGKPSGNVADRNAESSLAAIFPWFGIPMLIGAGLIVVYLRTVYLFHEHGAIVRRGKRVLRALRYDTVSEFTYSLTRQYYNGIYTGTAMKVKLRSPGQRSISYSGRHKQRPDGILSYTVGAKKFKGEDELDTVKMIISHVIVQSWLSREEESDISWAGVATLAPNGITPRRGRNKGKVIAYSEIKGFGMKSGWLSVWTHDDQKASLVVPINGVNFWPGMEYVDLHRGTQSAASNEALEPELQAPA